MPDRCPWLLRFSFLFFPLLFLALGTTRATAQTTSDYLHWYLPEGAQNAVFDEEILITNPSTEGAHVTVTLFPEPGAGTQTTVPITVGPHSRYTFRLAELFPDTINGAVSARVDSTNGVPIAVERSMYWPSGVRGAGHNALGLTTRSTLWHLAEGASGFWQDFILLVNPNAVPATVNLTFLPAAGGVPRSMTRVLEPGSRNTVWVNGHADVPAEFRNAEFATTISSDHEIAVERAMYWDNFAGGTDSTGTLTPAQTWHFGEGATSGNTALQFETFLLLQNPNPRDVVVRVSFFKDGGGVVERDFRVAAETRRTISARLHVPELGRTGFSMTAQSTDPNLPIVAERAMYWLLDGRPSPADGHTVQGVNALSPAWVFAEGIQGRVTGVPAAPYETFFLLSNPHPFEIELRVKVVREDGSGTVRPLFLPPQSRYTLYMGATDSSGRPLYPEASHQRFATYFQSLGARPPGFLAERAVYWGGLNGGHASAGVPWGALPVAREPFPVPPPQITAVTPGEGRLSGGTTLTITGRGFQQGATVHVGGMAAANVRVLNDTTITASTPPAAAARTGTVTLRVTNADGQRAESTFTYNFHVLAFGDSITYGTTSGLMCSGTSCSIQSIRVMHPYPSRLQQFLVNDPRFAAGGVLVQNAGDSGECASFANCGAGSGESRFAQVLDGDPEYDFVILLEGVNDLVPPGGDSSRIDNAANGLRHMVLEAKRRAKMVVICKLTPVEDDALTGEPRRSPAEVAALNDRIEALTVEEGLFRINWSGIDLSPDGLHPSQEGYDAMAHAVFEKITSILAVR